MDAIVLAGGLGTRLRSVVADVPKPLAPINGRPFLDILLDQLERIPDVANVVLAVGYMADVIVERYASGSARRFGLRFSREASPLGTGGAIRQALAQCSSDPVLILNGDSFFELDYAAMRRQHDGSGAILTVAVTQVDDSGRYGAVDIEPGGSRILHFREKDGVAARGWVNTGCYLLASRAHERFPAGASSFERDVVPGLLAGTHAYAQAGTFIDIGTPGSYALAHSVLDSASARPDV